MWAAANVRALSCESQRHGLELRLGESDTNNALL